MGKQGETVSRSPIPAERRPRSRIVGNTALKHHAASDRLGPNDLVEVVADNGPAQASRHLCLGGARESADWMAVSINTVHRSPSSTALGALRARGPNSANGIPMRAACSSTKEPVPAAQILFI